MIAGNGNVVHATGRYPVRQDPEGWTHAKGMDADLIASWATAPGRTVLSVPTALHPLDSTWVETLQPGDIIEIAPTNLCSITFTDCMRPIKRAIGFYDDAAYDYPSLLNRYAFKPGGHGFDSFDRFVFFNDSTNTATVSITVFQRRN